MDQEATFGGICPAFAIDWPRLDGLNLHTTHSWVLDPTANGSHDQHVGLAGANCLRVNTVEARGGVCRGKRELKRTDSFGRR